jgi:hypothetical protein
MHIPWIIEYRGAPSISLSVSVRGSFHIVQVYELFSPVDTRQFRKYAGCGGAGTAATKRAGLIVPSHMRRLVANLVPPGCRHLG